jgi:hypothetical protein
MSEFIYVLFDKAIPDQYRYCGRTDSFARRLREHLASACEDGTAKERWIHTCLEAGGQIDIKPLATITNPTSNVEDMWIENLRQKGHDLLNATGGSASGFDYQPGEVQPWSLDLFTAAEWKPSAQCKSGEKHAMIKGIDFFRQGKRKLRFFSVQYGNWDCHGSTPEAKYQRAIDMLTQGTQANNDLKAHVAMIRRMGRQ